MLKNAYFKKLKISLSINILKLILKIYIKDNFNIVLKIYVIKVMLIKLSFLTVISIKIKNY